MTSNQIGALFMMGSMAAFTFNDALVKTVGADLPLSQILVLRGLLSSLFIALLGWRLGQLTLRLQRRDKILVAGRSLAEASAAYFFLTALSHMPLANVSAVLQVAPLTVTLGSALVFSEPVGWRRWTAILIGFGGMLLIVRPGTDGFDMWSVYALAAVLCVTARDLATRRLTREVPSLTVTLAASVGVLIFAGLTAYDTQNIKTTYLQHAHTGDSEWLGKAAIMGALSLYLDFINMFMFLLQLFGNRE